MKIQAIIAAALFALFGPAQAFDPSLDGEINPLESGLVRCWAYSPIGDGNTFISGNADKIKIVVTKKGKVNAYCHVQDGSGVYEAQAEQAKVEECGITLMDGTVVIGKGHVVASANFGEDAGGNMRLHCQGQL